MNNYSYSSPNNSSFPSFSSQYSSTPAPNNNTRFQRPRFAYAGPPNYPRPRSSASKPNPDSYPDAMNDDFGGSPRQLDAFQEVTRNFPHNYNDSMRNNYGDSTLHMGDSLSMNSSTRDSSYGNSYLSSANSSYYTGNESFQSSPQKSSLLSTYQNDSAQFNYNKGSFGASNNMQSSTSYFNSKPDGLSSTQGLSGTNTRGGFGSRGRGNFRGRFQKKKPRGGGMQQGGSATQQTYGAIGSSNWRCSVCSIDFTSRVPLEMHLNGAKHAKKLKAENILRNIKGQASTVKEIQKPDGKKFVCELCNVILNSSLQLQMHLEGTKHKTKLNPPSKEETAENKEAAANKTDTNDEVLNGKTNGGLVRPAPDEAEGRKPSKMAKFACDICDLIVNSEVQLTQHLTSKKHQAKLEGKPIIRKRKPKEENGEQQQSTDKDTIENAAKPELPAVVGVKTLSSSFVQGGTLS